MPKLERLSWLAPLSEGRGITLSDDPEADLLLAADGNALILGVLYDSQFATRKAFAIPLRLQQRLGHLNMSKIATEDPAVVMEIFSRKPALHRFPNRNAQLTQKLAATIVSEYSGNADRIWLEAGDVGQLGLRLMALPAFGIEKTNWTVGMLGILGLLPFGGWEEYKAEPVKKSAAPRKPKSST